VTQEIPAAPDVAEAPKKPAKKSKTAAAPKPKAEPATPPRDIPLIETANDNRSHPDVTYITGGIGEDEQQMLEAVKPEYNLHIMSASMNGAFVGDAQVLITRGNGEQTEEMLNVVAGPLLYVKLPAGSYSLLASLGEQTKRQNFTIGVKRKTARVHLGWNVHASVSR
jgi:hypothetical protein